ncbi:MAG: hypothetical protein F6K30_19035 [Cyanothece sp. SIO2G6]|nr:hypothetical protein [Cyanothece sp. SIO2G6]
MNLQNNPCPPILDSDGTFGWLYCERARSRVTQVEHPIHKALVLAELANAHWHQQEVLPCLWLLFRSFVMLPPWKSANRPVRKLR